MSGGKGGGSTSEVTVPEYIERAAQRNLNKAEGISQIGYTPYYGPDVAAFTPMQQAAFQNTADASSAFGMAAPTSQQDIMGGMGAPTTYANGVSGYSSQPMFQQSLDQLQAERPGQFDYINSFFIDPFTGQAGSRVSAPVNYEDYMTAAEGGRVQADANRANDLAMAYVEANAGPESYYNYSNIDYSPTSSATSHITNPANGITDTSAPGVGEGAFNDFSEAVVGFGGFFDPTLKVGAINNPIKTPTVSEMVDAATVGMDYNPTTGGYVSNTDDGPSSSLRPVSRPEEGDSPSSSSVDLPGNVISRTLNIGAGKKDESSDSGYAGSSGDGCVVATHAVESGAFTPNMKREAVVWCMNALHGKWWGEAVRRGYRHLGKKKIEQGKAREHYQEFRRYIAFASGKKRDVRGAITFALRTAQFFAVGLIKKDA
jgi:hypothetical protein